MKKLTVFLLLGLCMPWSGRAFAQQVAYADQGRASAKELSAQALECLRQGEAASTEEAKLAAYREGLAIARRAVAADDLNADAHFAAFANNGRILLLEGATANFFNLLNASRELDRALELNPNHPDALASKGGLYRQLPWVLGGNLSKAERYLRRAIEVDPTTILPRIELAETYRDMGQPERSIPLLREAVELGTREGKEYRVAQARKLLDELHAAP